MNTQDKMELLNTAIQNLMQLYQILDGELPHMVYVREKSELKKITVKLLRFIGRGKKIYS